MQLPPKKSSARFVIIVVAASCLTVALPDIATAQRQPEPVWFDATPKGHIQERTLLLPDGTVVLKAGLLVRPGARSSFLPILASASGMRVDVFVRASNRTPHTIWVDAEVRAPNEEKAWKDSSRIKEGFFHWQSWGTKEIAWDGEYTVRVLVYADKERKKQLISDSTTLAFSQAHRTAVEEAREMAARETKREAFVKIPYVTISGLREPEFPTLAGVSAQQGQAAVAQVARLVAYAEAYEMSRAGRPQDISQALQSYFGGSPKVVGELKAGGALLADYLKQERDDIKALFLVARLCRVYDVLTPQVITGGEVQPREAVAKDLDPQAALDRILELDHGNPEAYYWKARLYGVQGIRGTGDDLSHGPADLGKAIEFAQIAVRGAPENIAYREALAMYLVMAGRRAEAREAMKDTVEGKHPIHLLLADESRIPVPDGAVPVPHMVETMTGKLSAGGIDYPQLRVRAFAVNLPASEVEAFYRQRWERFRLYEIEKEKDDEGGVLRVLAAEVDWLGDELRPTGKKPKEEAEYRPDFLGLGVAEMHNAPEEAKRKLNLPLPHAEPFCTILLVNLHHWKPARSLRR